MAAEPRGVGLDLVLTLPVLVLPIAAVTALRAGLPQTERRAMWLWLAAACGIGAIAAAIGVVEVLAGGEPALGLYVGAAGSAALVGATACFARRAVATTGLAGVVDPLMVGGLVVSLAVFLVVVPGFAHGDALLTGVLVLDLVAFALAVAGLASYAPTAVKGWLLGGVGLAGVGDALVAAHAAGLVSVPDAVAPGAWGAAGLLVVFAARRERPMDARDAAPPSHRGTYVKVLPPVAAVLGYPALVLVLLASGRSGVDALVFFGPFFLATTFVASARQAVLHAEALRRNRELAALTGLATTMTGELEEEAAVVERGLQALCVAAGASASSLHLVTPEDELKPAMSTGDWGEVGTGHMARLSVGARGRTLGRITLMRPVARGPFDAEELGLLGLLADQLGVALQGVRDRSDRLEAAIRDPLTGLYNRRFFNEALAKEVARHERYGTGAALVVFDLDDLRRTNEAVGRSAGDHALEQVGRVLEQLVRPSDTFARIGGQKFGLLMPETGQLDALLVAERLRTAVGRREILQGQAVTLSGGVAAMPQDGTTCEELERAAGQALHWAKRNGKNLCAVASEAIAGDGDFDGMLAHLHGVVAGIDAIHLHTRDHSENVASYAVAIGQVLGLDPDRIVKVRRAAFLHDIGKVAVPDDILSKPASLTEDEFELIRLHPSVGSTMLRHAGLFDEAQWVRCHHERIDGTGYPDALAGDAVPMEARILFVADSFEAMTSDRPYRRGMPSADALAELRRCAGSQFDPIVVEALAGLVEGEHMAVLALRDRVDA